MLAPKRLNLRFPLEMKKKMTLRWAACLIAILVTACQSTPDVLVVDSKGAAVAGAAVEPVSLSINYEAVMTDAKGGADIPSKVQEVVWINVRKAGFADQRSIKFTGPKPVRVVLSP